LLTPTIGCRDLVIRRQCTADHKPEWGRSWLNVRRDQSVSRIIMVRGSTGIVIIVKQ